MSRVPKAKMNRGGTKGMQDHEKPIMQPNAPWKETPKHSMPMAGPGQGRTFSYKEATKGLDHVMGELPSADEEGGYGGFADTGLTMVPTKRFPVKAEGYSEGDAAGGSARGGFPKNPPISGHGNLLNVGGEKSWVTGFGEETKAPVAKSKKKL